MGVARQRRDHLSTKVGCTCAIGEVGVSSVDPAVSRDRDSPCDRRAFESAFPALADPQVSHPGNRSIARSRVLFTNGRGVKTRIKRAATNAEDENQSSKVNHRDISLDRTRARRYRTAACLLEILSIPRQPSSLAGSCSRKVTRRTPNDRPGVLPSKPIDKSTRIIGTRRARGDRLRAACEYT